MKQLFAILIFVSSMAHASTKHSNVEIWCGATDATSRSHFPYLAAIHDVKTKSGMKLKMATVYKHGSVVLRQFVFRNTKKGMPVYETSGDTFSLAMSSASAVNPNGDFHAVIRDEDGEKFIANGAISCFKQKRG